MNFDPFSMQKNMLAQFEKSLNDMLSSQIKDPLFIKTLSQNMQQILDFEKLIKPEIETMLKKMHIPTNQELLKLDERLNRLETKFLNMEEELIEIKQELKTLKSKKSSAKPKLSKKVKE